MNTLELIRRNVFGVDQAAFAAIAGVTQPTVSRWENGSDPTLSSLLAIRYAAMARGLPWNDTWFFAPPPAWSEARKAA